MLAATRERRPNAGRKIAELLEKEDTVDEFYQSQYGGFFDEAEDKGFESPVESDSDIVDSDFDASEDDEPCEANDDEDAVNKKRSRRVVTAAYKEPRYGDEPRPKKARTSTSQAAHSTGGVSTNHQRERRLRHSTIRKSAEAVVRRKASSVVGERRTVTTGKRHRQTLTQAQLLKEAELTEKQNLASLKQHQEFEMEQKRKRDRILKRRRVIDGPKIRFLSLSTTENKRSQQATGEKCCRNFLEFSSDAAFQSHGRLGEKRTCPPKALLSDTCPVTGLKAKYRDPLTKLPYANAEAFKQLRSLYEAYLLENAETLGKTHPEIAKWFLQVNKGGCKDTCRESATAVAT